MKKMVVVNINSKPSADEKASAAKSVAPAADEDAGGKKSVTDIVDRMNKYGKAKPFKKLFPVLSAFVHTFSGHLRFGGPANAYDFAPPEDSGFRPVYESLPGVAAGSGVSAKSTKSEASAAEFEAAADKIRVYLGDKSEKH